MNPRAVTVAEAADLLGLSVTGVEALSDAGYLRTDGEHVPLAELKSFQARNTTAHGASSVDVLTDLTDLTGADTGADEILAALDVLVPEMARRAGDIMSGLFPDPAAFTGARREQFEKQTRRRFEAILSVTRSPEAADDLLEDLADAGGAAAFAGAPLPQVLLTLRVSRDLLVQTAVSAAEELGQDWSLALAVVLTRVLPVLDRLTDTVARGYWSAVVTREQEAFARFEHVVEHSASGVYEVDNDGVLRYLNPMMAQLCGVAAHDVLGKDLAAILPPVDGSISPGVYRTPTVSGWRTLRVLRNDGVARELQLQITQRTVEGLDVGYDGVVRDVTAERTLERQKNAFLELMTHELRQPLTTILGLGVTLDLHAHDLTPDRVASIGRTIHVQSERIARLADDLHDISRIRADNLVVSPGRIQLATACTAAMRMLSDPDEVTIDVDPELWVTADGRRLEQVLAHLVENGLRHGRAPVAIEARRCDGVVRIAVTDHGDGVPDDEVPDLFEALRTTGADHRLRDRPSGLGLALARALVEAMGGRISYAPAADGGARFVVHVQTA